MKLKSVKNIQISPKFSIMISCRLNNEHISKQLNENISSCFSYDWNKEIFSVTIEFFVFSSNESKFCFINKYKQTKAPSLTFFDSSFDNSNNLFTLSDKFNSSKILSIKEKD